MKFRQIALGLALATGAMTPIGFTASNHLAAPKLFLLKADPAASTYKAVE